MMVVILAADGAVTVFRPGERPQREVVERTPWGGRAALCRAPAWRRRDGSLTWGEWKIDALFSRGY